MLQPYKAVGGLALVGCWSGDLQGWGDSWEFQWEDRAATPSLAVHAHMHRHAHVSGNPVKLTFCPAGVGGPKALHFQQAPRCHPESKGVRPPVGTGWWDLELGGQGWKPGAR